MTIFDFLKKLFRKIKKYETGRPLYPEKPVLPLEQRTSLNIRTALNKAPNFPDMNERRDYLDRAMTQFKEDDIAYIFQRKYKSIDSLHLDDILNNYYIEKAK